MKNTFILILMIVMLGLNSSKAQNKRIPSKWMLSKTGGIEWILKENAPLPASDHMAMSGMQVDMILEWAISKEKVFSCTKVIRWPMLRVLPNDTHASLQRKFSDDHKYVPTINEKFLSEGTVQKVEINGLFMIESVHSENLKSKRIIFPSVHAPAIIDMRQLINTSGQAIQVSIPSASNVIETNQENGFRGVYVLHEFVIGTGHYMLAPGESLNYTVVTSGRQKNDTPYFANPGAEFAGRSQLLKECADKLVLETPDPVLNRLFYFSKIRAAESIFSTRGGLMHGPGGYNKYLAAIWANDQAEYINPFFPFLGNVAGNESAMNSFRHFAGYMNDGFNPIPSSIIAEGIDYWNGAGDRGDMAMIAYGAARFALASGNPEWSAELWPLINWCLEYNHLKKLPQGVIASDSDELEGRFPAGKANLSTSCLYYDALISAAYLGAELNKDQQLITRYKERAKELRTAIQTYFEMEVEGYNTYQYYEGNTVLRSWICIPMTVGIMDRAEGTIEALFSTRLWTENGLLTKAGTTTVWDRSTLFALRGVMASEYADKGLPRLHDFSRERLLGDHVPYVNEAYPEQNQSHLSAESGLYCRIFIEGLFGIRPTGWDRFSCTPRLLSDWDSISLSHIHAFGRTWSIAVKRDGRLLNLSVQDAMGTKLYDQSLPQGVTHAIDFSEF